MSRANQLQVQGGSASATNLPWGALLYVYAATSHQMHEKRNEISTVTKKRYLPFCAS